MLAAQAIRDGDSEIVIAGGQESMSLAPHVLPGSRDGQRMGDWKMVDSMIIDGLFDVYNQYHMGITAENVAKKYDITPREAGRARARLAAEGRGGAGGRPLQGRDRAVQHRAEEGRPDRLRGRRVHQQKTSAEALAGLRPAFDKAGSVTAGNASGLNDGAAGVVRDDGARRPQQLGLTPLARIASYATVALDPASWAWARCRRRRRRCSAPAGRPQDLDLLEINEAFAAQACAVNNEMGWDTSKVNVNGGAIAIGHPIGASGCRILVTLLHEMQRRNAKKGIASLCIGGGMGVALTSNAERRGDRPRSRRRHAIHQESMNMSTERSPTSPAAWAASARRCASACTTTASSRHRRLRPEPRPRQVAGRAEGARLHVLRLGRQRRRLGLDRRRVRRRSRPSTARSTCWSTTPASRATACSAR